MFRWAIAEDFPLDNRRVASQLQVLSQLPSSNFWITLHWAFQDKKFCYLAFDLLIGGDLRYHLSNIGRTFTEKETGFYISSVILCLGHVSIEKLLYLDLRNEGRNFICAKL